MRTHPAINRRNFIAGAAGVIAAAPDLAAAASTPVVKTSSGSVQGQMDGDAMRFLGIPYGKARRFERSMSVRWKGVRACNAFGPISPQSGAPSNALVSEDCQVLNLWTGATGGKPRPVMVWLHGGGFHFGSANSSVFNGAALAARYDVVVVTINHRLGVLGAFRLDNLDSRFGDAGTAGMLDIIDALQWVKQSIAAFGGDPNCVTVFGQSGGGGKVMTLLAMPEACKLMHRAIIQSGTMRQTSATAEQGAAATGKLFGALSIRPGDIAALRALPVKDLIAAQDKVQQEPTPGRRPWAPIIDGKHLPEQPFGEQAPECSRHIPLMVGSNTEELRPMNLRRPEMFKLDDAGLRRALEPILGERRKSAIGVYRIARPEASLSDLFFAITADEMYWSNSVRVLDFRTAQKGAPVHTYRFAYAPDRQDRDGKVTVGAGHGQENEYAFDHIPADAPEASRRLAKQISGAWTAFARDGDPNQPATLPWSPYDSERRMTMVFDAPASQISDPYRNERLWWSEYSG